MTTSTIGTVKDAVGAAVRAAVEPKLLVGSAITVGVAVIVTSVAVSVIPTTAGILVVRMAMVDG